MDLSAKLSRTQIASGGTVAALGALAAFALSAAGGQPKPKPAAQEFGPRVKTVVVRRTVGVLNAAPAAKAVAPVAAGAVAAAPARAVPAALAVTPAASAAPRRARRQAPRSVARREPRHKLEPVVPVAQPVRTPERETSPAQQAPAAQDPAPATDPQPATQSPAVQAPATTVTPQRSRTVTREPQDPQEPPQAPEPQDTRP